MSDIILQLAAAEKRLKQQIEVTAEVRAERDAAVQRAETAEAQCAVLREALEQAQWGDHQGPIGGMCPKCEGEPGDGFGHFQGCIIGKALATDAGAVLLAEVRRLRAIETTLSEIMPGIRAFLAGLPPRISDDGAWMWAQSNSRGEAPGISAGMLRRLVAALEATE